MLPIFCTAPHTFQSTPPCGRRRPEYVDSSLGGLFQSTPPCGRRLPTTILNKIIQKMFQSTPPCGRRRVLRLPSIISLCFNPRLRAGGDLVRHACSPLLRRFQSTPPCGRRLKGIVDQYNGLRVSIHASVREATDTGRIRLLHPRCFNPRLRAGGDSPCGGDHRLSCQFQSTPPCGRRPLPAGHDSLQKLFQSTPPCGRRRRSLNVHV